MIDVRSILNKGVKWDLIYRNVASNIDLPKVSTEERPYLEPAEILKLIDNAPIRERTIMACAAFAALREGEIFGLQWEDIRFSENETIIRLSRQYTDNKIDTDLKTKGSKATIKICKKLNNILKEWQSIYPWSKWVFPGKGTGKPLCPTTWESRTFKKELIKNGLSKKIVFHDLRHFFVSFLLNEGASMEDVKVLSRHKNIQTTIDIYSHISPKRIDKILDMIDNYPSKITSKDE
jgi:integrase